MRYKDVQCVYCNKIFTDSDDVVTCPQCGSPHHRECWEENGKCANDGKHSEGFSWQFPEGLAPKINLKNRVSQEKKPLPTQFKVKNGEGAVICPYCSAANCENDVVCIKCRRLLVPVSELDLSEFSTQTQKMPDTENEIPQNEQLENNINSFFGDGDKYSNGENQFAQREQVFEYVKKYGGLKADSMIEGIPVREYAEYIGTKKSGRYIKRFAFAQRFGRRVMPSIAAFIFGPVWFFYKKLYKEGSLYLIGILILSLISGFCSLTQPVKDTYSEISGYYEQVMNGEMSLDEFYSASDEITAKYADVQLTQQDRVKSIVSSVAYYMNFFLTFAMSFVAEGLYYKKIRRDILSAREQCSDMPSYLNALREKGKPSVLGVVVAVLLSLAIYFAGSLPAMLYIFGLMK